VCQALEPQWKETQPSRRKEQTAAADGTWIPERKRGKGEQGAHRRALIMACKDEQV
jgi:hypothetical protein